MTKLFRGWRRAVPARTLLTYAFMATVLGLASVPVLYYGSHGFHAIHDNLDSVVAYYNMLRVNGLFFSLEAPSTMLHGVAAKYFCAYSMNLSLLPFAFLNPFRAYILTYLLTLVTAYVSMSLLLCLVFPRHKNLMRLVAVAYAILPLFPAFSIAYAAVPLLPWAFLLLARGPKRPRKGVWLLLCYLPFASFAQVGLFMLPLWFLAACVLWIREKRPNWNLFLGFLLLLVLSLATDYKLLYTVLFDQTLLIRESFALQDLPILATWWPDFIQGIYHAPPMQRLVVVPVIVAAAGVCLLLRGRAAPFHLRQRKEKKETASHEASIMLANTLSPSQRETWHAGRLALILLLVAGFFSLLYALYHTMFWNRLVAAIIPLLGGFNWSRISVQNRVLFYVAFAAALVAVSTLRLRGKRLGVPLCVLLVCLQIFAVLRGADFGYFMLQTYNTAHHNLFWEETQEESLHLVPWDDFYSIPLFNKIKEDIAYDGEWTVAVGFHPAVLTYNGFSTLDGYLSVFPMEYKEAFRQIIAPELSHSPTFRTYYDDWGARAYVFNSEVPYEVTKWRENPPITLRIDADAFRALDGKYIISRSQVENAEELGLTLLNRYDGGGLYILYVYN